MDRAGHIVCASDMLRELFGRQAYGGGHRRLEMTHIINANFLP